MTLLDHNRQTLNEVNSFIKEGRNCCVVNPCGSGKTAVMAAFIEENPESSFVIITKQKNAAQYYRKKNKVFCTDHISIVTYNRMLSDVKANVTGIYDTDYLLIDEAHYLGAPKWNAAFKHISEMYHPRLIGFTATPQRFEDQGTNHTIVTDIFDGNSAGNFSTKQLEKDGVLVEPEYVLSIYNLQNLIEEKMERVEDSDLDEPKKKQIFNRLNTTLDRWNNESNPEHVLAKYLPHYMYRPYCNRILVYVTNVDDIPEKKRFIDNAIKKIFPDKSVTSYAYTYKTSEDELRKFLKDDRRSDIKILYSIDKIMETIHIDDLRIIIMLRPSVSNRIITQQFGRINNINNKNKPIIIDMVDNLSNINSINNSLTHLSPPKSEPKNPSLNLPHISFYSNVFSAIDKTLSRFQYFTYQGFTGSISDICAVFGKRTSEVKELMLAYTLEEAMQLAKNVGSRVTQEALDGVTEIPEFRLTEEQRKYAEANIGIVDRFIERRNVTDDDMKQNLYITYLYRVHMTDGKYEAPYSRKQRILLALKSSYIKLLRNNAIRDRLIVYYDDHFKDTAVEYNLDYELQIERFKTAMYFVMEHLTRREIIVLLLRFGFMTESELQKYRNHENLIEAIRTHWFHPNTTHTDTDHLWVTTLEKTGMFLGVQRERVRQIEAKAVRKLGRCSYATRMYREHECIDFFFQHLYDYMHADLDATERYLNVQYEENNY